MSDAEQLPAEIRNAANDYVVLGVRAMVGAVPFAGSLLAELAGVVIPNQRIERIAKFAARLELRINGLEREAFSNRFSDEGFTELLEEALRQAARSTTDDRREYLASLVAHSLTSEEQGENDHRHLLRILGEINDTEVIWLRSYVGAYTGSTDTFRAVHEATLRPARATLSGPQEEADRQTLQESYLNHLAALGLLKRSLKLDRNKQPEMDSSSRNFAYTSPGTTPLGRMLLRVIGLLPPEA